jgi:formamidopyrimidine-DNA glycosylase
MPEIPDLEGYRAYFNRRLPGARLESVGVIIPWVLRAPKDDVVAKLAGNVFREVERRGKYLLFAFESGDRLVVHAMLTGRFQYVEPKTRKRAKTALILGLENGMEVRYFDQRLMGKAYLAREEELDEKVPRWAEMGPDVMSADLTEDGFVERQLRYRGQMKNVITKEKCVAGIGNAYADEVLWEAQIHPYRKRTEVDEEVLRRLYRAIRSVIEEATAIVTERMEADGLPSDHYRDHLKIHRKGGEACPRCGNRISEITAGQRLTNFCRRCQE